MIGSSTLELADVEPALAGPAVRAPEHRLRETRGSRAGSSPRCRRRCSRSTCLPCGVQRGDLGGAVFEAVDVVGRDRLAVLHRALELPVQGRAAAAGVHQPAARARRRRPSERRRSEERRRAQRRVRSRTRALLAEPLARGIARAIGRGAARPVPSAPVSTFRCMLLNELTDGMEIDQVLLVREAERRAAPRRRRLPAPAARRPHRRGRLHGLGGARARSSELAPRGRAGARERPLHRAPALRPADQPARARAGRSRAATRSSDLLDGPARDVEQMEAELRELLATDPAAAPARAARARVRRGLASCGPATATAPAAKYYHQAYRHGLLEHCLGVAQAVSAISATFPGIDRDVAVTGALLHDIGKLEAYTDDPQQHRPHRRRAPARRDRARLLPHPPRDRGDRRLPARSSRRRCCTSSSPTTARSSTAARSCRARARRRSCT